VPQVLFISCVRVDDSSVREFSGRYDAAMPRLGIPTLGWLTAVLLSLVTIFVFGSLQNYGPDSTVRQFHQAAAELDRNGAAALVSPDFDSSSTQMLWRELNTLLANGKTEYQISHYQRKANQAAIVVRYRFTNGEARTLVWVVSRMDGKWKIDTRETLLAAQYLLSTSTIRPLH
jgi:hypothetical protein